MSARSWFRKLFARMLCARKPARPITRRRPLELEALEDRVVPALLTVNSILDNDSRDDYLTLREAVGLANGTLAVADLSNAEQAQISGTTGAGVTDSIAFDLPAGSPRTLVLTGGQLVLTDLAETTIDGGTAGVTIDGNNSRVFQVESAAHAALTGFTLTGGRSQNGGAINNQGTLTVSSSTLTNNGASNAGAGIHNTGTLTITSSTLVNNSTSGLGGGIYNQGTVTIESSTVTANRAQRGGGLYNDGTATITGSTLTKNQVGGGAPIFSPAGAGIYGSATLTNTLLTDTVEGTLNSSSANNLLVGTGAVGGLVNGTNANIVVATATEVGLDPAGLKDNGGPTHTIALMAGSPAIDAGIFVTGVTTDQRGYGRPQFGAADIGAVEWTPQEAGATRVTTADGAVWYLGLTPTTGDRPIYRQAPGTGVSSATGGFAVQLGLQADGAILARNATGAVYLRDGSVGGALGTGWTLLTGVAASDGATWFLGSDGDATDRNVYRWATGEAPAGVAPGTGIRIGVHNGEVVVQNTAEEVYARAGSATGVGSHWVFVTASLTVTTNADENDLMSSPNGALSLREAVALANALAGEDEITFALPDALDRTILLTGGQLVLTDLAETTIDGGTAGVTIDGNNATRLFQVGLEASSENPLPASVTLANLTLTRGYSPFEGGALISYFSNLTVTNSTLDSNSARSGGAIASLGGVNLGSVSVTNSTFVNNVSQRWGGAISSVGSILRVSTSTITGNTAQREGGGIWTDSLDKATLHNSLVIGNSAGSDPDVFDVTAGPDSLVGLPSGTTLGQIIQVDGNGRPLLAANGGPTQTIALVSGSPAIAAGVALDDVTTDQRGLARNATPDIGAFETQDPTVQVFISGGTYNGSAYGATAATVTGLGGTVLADFGGTNPVNTDAVTFQYFAVTSSSSSSSGSSGSSGSGSGLKAIGSNAPTDAGNYVVIATFNSNVVGYRDASSVTVPFTIAPKGLTITATNQTTIYGYGISLGTSAFTATGLVNGDAISSVTLTSDGASTTASAGQYAIVATNAEGTGLANYDINYVVGTLQVDRRSILGYFDVADKVYDGTTQADILYRRLHGVVNNDDVSLVGGTAEFNDKRAGLRRPVSLRGATITGSAANNYTLGSIIPADANILPRTLTITAVADAKVYDGTTASGLLPTLDGVQTGDSVTGLAQVFTSANVLGTNLSTLVVTGYTINDGNDGNNYTVEVASVTGTITPRALTGAITAEDRYYDGTTTATASPTSLTGVLGSDDVALTVGAATFDSKDAGVRTVTTEVSLTGAAAGNYQLTSPTASTAANIRKVGLTVTADAREMVFGEAVPVLTYTVTGFIPSETLATSGVTGAPVLSTLATASSPVDTYPITVALGNLSAGNYDFTTFVDGTLTVTAAPTELRLTSSMSNPLLGTDGLTLTATLTTPIAGITPTGSITFLASTRERGVAPIVLGTASVSANGTAVLDLSAVELNQLLTDREYLLDAVYAPTDGNFLGAETFEVTRVAPVAGGTVQGMVYADLNNNGELDFGEQGIAGVKITLTGNDDEFDPVMRETYTDAFGVYTFTNLRPSARNGYTITQTQPTGWVDGLDTAGTVTNGVYRGDLNPDEAANDTFNRVILGSGAVAENFNFGERPMVSSPVGRGDTAGIGFWQNKNGQELIRSLNGGANSTQLGNWLAANFANLYGSLAGKTNAQVAAHYKTLFALNGKTGFGGPPKTDAQVMAVALAAYVTNSGLAGNVAAAYRFNVSAEGTGAKTFHLCNNGEAFGVANNSNVSVINLLLAVNSRSRNGRVGDADGNGRASSLETAWRTIVNDVFSTINERGGI